MKALCNYTSYKETGFFSKLITDYLQGDPNVKPFYKHEVSIEGIKASIEARKLFNNDRQLLQNELVAQYKGITFSTKQQHNIDSLLSDTTFTVCTAHQPNIFTGHLYFIYKILHTIKLAATLSVELPQYHFVPVFYMGSEDADLEELGTIDLNGETLVWKTAQTGAVGRMVVDKLLIELMDRMEGELSVMTYGKEIMQVFRNAYQVGVSIQQATLQVIDQLFKDYGLLTIIPDNGNLKKAFNGVVKKELVEEFSQPLVLETSAQISKHYKAQASGREINLFYLVDGVRERIVRNNEGYWVSRFRWSEAEILDEVDNFPERFSANVILRGAFQETILPNIAFIGGGGEIAYWLQLKKVFEAAGVSYPVLILRNSFTIITTQQKNKIEKLGFGLDDFFASEQLLVDRLVLKNSGKRLSLQTEKQTLDTLYNSLEARMADVDLTLKTHVKALYNNASKKMVALEKKMLRAEKRKYESQLTQIAKLKANLFPKQNLQERVDNIAPYYSRMGPWLIEALYDASLTLESKFCTLVVEDIDESEMKA